LAIVLAASTLQQCQSGSDFNDSTFAKHSHEPEPSLLVCLTIQRFNVAKPDRQRVRFSFHSCARSFNLGFLGRPMQRNPSILRQMNTLKYALIAIATLILIGSPEVNSSDVGKPETPLSEEFQAMLARVDAAQLELQNGQPAAFKALWSHADDVTLSGGFGGTIEKGWESISRRLDWVGAAVFTGDKHTRANRGKRQWRSWLCSPDRASPLPRSRSGEGVDARLSGNNDIPA
jgi:hypothetical protein